MSRIGKNPVALPKGIEAKVDNGVLVIKNSKITRELGINGKVEAKIENNQIVFFTSGQLKTR